VRDAVLGVEMINGHAERLRFGGQVMKNVAGYDLSRLQAGAHGTLGVLLAASVRVNPAPEVERTLVFDLDGATALRRVRQYASRPWPVTATWHAGERLCVRLSGSAAAVEAASLEFGGETLEDSGFWSRVRDRREPEFARPEALWRVLCPPAAPLPDVHCAVEWGGGLRWLAGVDEDDVVGYARAVGGAAYRADQPALSCSGPPIAARLKFAFDPLALFNRGLGPAPAVDHAH
jgi:glycolate oxidase FAD binding subunit